MVDTADSKSAFYRFDSGRGYFYGKGVDVPFYTCPGDGMVDVPDLGSGFWEFKSPPGHIRPLGGMVDTVALKATLSRYRFESDSGYPLCTLECCNKILGSVCAPAEGYSLVVKWSIVDRLCWVRFPIVLQQDRQQLWGDG